MNIKLHGFLPTTGDSRGVVGGGHSVPQDVGLPAGPPGSATAFREANIDYLANVARTADRSGSKECSRPLGRGARTPGWSSPH